MSSRQKGYTLLELMLILAVLSILMMIAIPAYQEYKYRAMVVEGISVMAGVRREIETAYQSTGIWPSDNLTAGIGPPESFQTKYLDSIEVGEDGVVTVTYGGTSTLNGETIIWTPTATGGNFQWDCKGGTLVDKLRPTVCKSDV